MLGGGHFIRDYGSNQLCGRFPRILFGGLGF